MTVLLAVTVYVKKFIIIYIDVKHKTVRNRKRTKTAVLNLQSVQSVRRGKTQKPNRDRQFNNIETVKVPTLGSGINDVMFGGGVSFGVGECGVFPTPKLPYAFQTNLGPRY